MTGARGEKFDETCELLAAAIQCLAAPVGRDRRHRLMRAVQKLPDGLPGAWYAFARTAMEYVQANEDVRLAPAIDGHAIAHAAEVSPCPHYGWQDRADVAA